MDIHNVIVVEKENNLKHLMRPVVETQIGIDEAEKEIHVLDLDLNKYPSITNCIEKVQDYLVASNDYSQIRDYKEWIWYLYGSDGVVCTFHRGNVEGPSFKFVRLDNEKLIPVFVEEMKKRLL